MEPFELSASDALRLICSRELSCEELARSTIQRIETRDPAVKAWVFFDPAALLRCARELDKAPAIGLAHGFTLGVKDVVQTLDMPTQHNSLLYQGHYSGQDAACVGIARSNGALIAGKTDTVEFASGGRLALTRNPNNLEYSPGGSSSGSAAAVADKQAQFAIGTQTGGSLIRPAAYNGIYAFKPTHGAVSTEGVKHLSHTCDTVGWYSRTVEDLALFSKMYRFPNAGTTKPTVIKGLKIGVCRGAGWPVADGYARAALQEASKRLESAGAIVQELTLPEPFDELDDAHGIIMPAEARVSFMAEYVGSNGHLMGKHFVDFIENSRKITPDDLIRTYDLAARCRAEFDALLRGKLDAVLTLASPGEPPLMEQNSTGTPVCNSTWTLLHAPCVAIPVGKSPRSLPLGVQLVGARLSDSRLLEIAKACAPAIHENGCLRELTPA